jgi:hypothetical protein
LVKSRRIVLPGHVERKSSEDYIKIPVGKAERMGKPGRRKCRRLDTIEIGLRERKRERGCSGID